jgi:hypothetical protein
MRELREAVEAACDLMQHECHRYGLLRQAMTPETPHERAVRLVRAASPADGPGFAWHQHFLSALEPLKEYDKPAEWLEQLRCYVDFWRRAYENAAKGVPGVSVPLPQVALQYILDEIMSPDITALGLDPDGKAPEGGDPYGPERASEDRPSEARLGPVAGAVHTTPPSHEGAARHCPCCALNWTLPKERELAGNACPGIALPQDVVSILPDYPEAWNKDWQEGYQFAREKVRAWLKGGVVNDGTS